MIKVQFDQNHIRPQINLTKLVEITDYTLAYRTILRNIEEVVDTTIFVSNPVIIQWLRNMSSRYPQGTFLFETIDARSALAQQWNVDVPSSVANEDILQMGLLSSDLRPQPGFSFEDTLLAHFYAPIFTSKVFPFTQMTALLESTNPQQWKANLAIPLLSRTLHARFEEWKSKARSTEQRQFIEMFAANPMGLKQKLMRFRVLRSYPQLGQALLGDDYYLLKALKLQLDGLEIDETSIQETVVQVTYLLNAIQVESNGELPDMIGGLSGLLAVEFDVVDKTLKHHPDWITPEIMDLAETKFESQQRRLGRRFRELRGLIQPPKPAFPDISWDAETMLSWATEDYLPYQSWCDTQERFDPELYNIGDRFSEWLMNKWHDIHANSKRMVFNILPNKAAELRRAGTVNLVLAVDNLSWALSETLRSLFQEQGYFLTKAEPYLAMVPSETEISKKCLLAGAVGYQQIDNINYKGLIEKGWVPYFHENAFRYISDIGGLSKIQSIDAATYVVNYLAVDKAMHKSADEIGMPHRDHIQHLLKKLVEKCMAFIEKHGLQESIRIHVVSDHGSTRIPTDIQNDLDLPFFRSPGFTAHSHRYVSVSDAQFTSLANVLKEDCFFLPAIKFLNPENVLCARRGNRFLPTDKTSYVHGGLLPEEMIVPYMVFDPAIIPIQDLTVLLKKKEFRYRMETVELEIGNPNDSVVEQIQVSLLNGNVDSDPERIVLLNGKTKALIHIQARFKMTNIPDDQTNLRIRVRFLVRGEQHGFETQAGITMKKLVEEKSSDIFDL